MQTIPWSPPGTDPALTGVMVPKGDLTERQWWMALADRVTGLVMQEKSPDVVMRQAARDLGVVEPDYPEQAGQVMVQRNLELMEALTLDVMANVNPFPAKVERADVEALVAMKQTDLRSWVAMAASRVNTSNLD